MHVVPRELDSLSRNSGIVEYGGAGVDILRLRGPGAPAEEPGGRFGNANHVLGAAGLRAVGAAGARRAACNGDGDGFGLAACTGPIRAGSVASSPDRTDVGLKRGGSQPGAFKVGTIDKGIEDAGHEGAEGFARHKRWRARVVKRSKLSGGWCIA